MRCYNCGVEIPEKEKFCVHCGAPRPVSSRSQSGKSQPKTRKPALWAGGGVGCSGILALVICVSGIILLPYVYPLFASTATPVAEVSVPLSPTPERTATQPKEAATSVPTVAPTHTQAPPKETPIPTSTALPDVSYAGISFSYDPSLAGGVGPERIPAVEAPEMAIAPEHVQFSFDGYIHSPSFHEPRIMVYPVDEYVTASPYAGEIVAGLDHFLEDKPASAPDGIPFLPLWNAAQFFQAQMDYLDFQSGGGVRFLTMYGQAAWPVNSHDLFYTYQGLSQDGRYYVSAIFPVSHPDLPVDGEAVEIADWMAFSENFMDHLVEMDAFLNAQPASSFRPDLSLLDAMIESLEIR